ncbi:MAG: tetratricopeptide repeat protein [Anaerolineae bacterium]|nr:tetratricopeptide repeat protein [Phycisphaerae bacterium]
MTDTATRSRDVAAPTAGRELMLGCALFVMTLTVFSPSLWNGFIWDDNDHLDRNIHLYDSLDVLSIWTVIGATPQFYPVVFSSFCLEYRIWGLRAMGYHLDNMLIQAASAVLLWRLLRRLGMGGAWVAAAVFAIHPVQVETVAWISERKNLLCGLFSILSAHAYIRFAMPELHDNATARGQRTGNVAPYLASFAVFCLAMFAKTVACTLPATFLLLIWWKRGRIRIRDIGRVVPFFVVGIGLGLITAILEREQIGAIGGDFNFGWLDRFGIAGHAVWFYAYKLLWPAQLMFFYPRWNVDATSAPWRLLFPASAIALVLSVYMLRSRIGRGPIVALLYFGGTLLPALSFVNVYPMRFSFVADHFQYLASLGIIALGVATVGNVLKRLNVPEVTRGGAAGLILLSLGISAVGQQRMYRDAQTLWSRTLELNPSAWLAANNLAVIHFNSRRYDQALVFAEQANRLKPDEPMVQTNLGLVYSALGRKLVALDCYRRAATAQPYFLAAQRRYGGLLRELGEDREAERVLRRAVALTPMDPRAYNELTTLLDRQGRFDDAIVLLRGATRSTQDLGVRMNLAIVLGKRGDEAAAAEVLAGILRDDPEHERARLMLGQLRSK